MTKSIRSIARSVSEPEGANSKAWAEQNERDCQPRLGASRHVISLLITLHLAAIFSAPWSAPPPSSELSQAVASIFAPYVKAIGMDNGYRFFVPDPGPSHIVRYEWEGPEGTVHRGEFPDRTKHVPRLLYHRHFMIAEMIYSLTFREVSDDELSKMPPPLRNDILRSRELARLFLRGVTRSLFREHADATKLRLYLVTHGMPSPLQVQQGAKLTDPAGYLPPILLGEFQRGGA